MEYTDKQLRLAVLSLAKREGDSNTWTVERKIKSRTYSRSVTLMPRKGTYHCGCDQFVREYVHGRKPCHHFIAIEIEMVRQKLLPRQKIKEIFGEDIKDISPQYLRFYMKNRPVVG